MLRPPKFPLLLLACCATWPAVAQQPAAPEDERIRVVPMENVKIDYAQVLGVEPVYQTLRATRVEERCDSTPVIQVQPPAGEEEASPGVLSRMVDSVKGLFAREEPRRGADDGTAAVPPRGEGCRLVQVDRQFQRPIAYDVDYVYKGTKYRSRLAEDPGNRLRIRVSVTPWVGDAPLSAP
ncbi:hypothetical protein B1992_03325 [Pseudoxanthomonas broegbernensis]|uniref:Uncharacterized protein n=1 Tax=Pseudoxanthomonas broegbernensis TaxID=83619 RepID=A0A7V8GPE1_9GAMM|nr:hypothetical protein [Pseudoxanthomonas broegbernensis]KAF1687698.1 hypothetical protein B1992_03325 [Pseudoxanthomonas broegbernensis]MBB6064729.1 uncharacterized protein YcfJ [Pseudoxanthomonas broegbernensis]